MIPTTRRESFLILCLLGALSIVSPFAIDLYLPAFTKMAADLGTSSAVISLSLSSYFIGLAFGQFIYGPLLDRYGRKKPIYIGLTIFIITAIGCTQTHDPQTLIALRLLQALGGCVAQVGAITMVHDFFPANQSAKIFSLLFLFIGASPLFAPSIGSLLMVFVGWRWIFVFMAGLVSLVLMAIIFLLPEGHKPDPTISLKPANIIATFIEIFKSTVFQRYALSGAFAFAGLFSYVAGAPIVFMEGFHISPEVFGGIFALLTMGFIGGSQINVFLLRRYSSEFIFSHALKAQATVGIVFFIGTLLGVLGFAANLALFFLFLLCAGLANPNGAALALAPFTKNAGSASAMLGALQLGTGALVSTFIGLSGTHNSVPVIGVLCATSLIGVVLYNLPYLKRVSPQ